MRSDHQDSEARLPRTGFYQQASTSISNLAAMEKKILNLPAAPRRMNGRRRNMYLKLTSLIAAVLVLAALIGKFSPQVARNPLSQAAHPTGSTLQRPRLAVTSSLWSDHADFARYAMTLGHSLVQSNGPFLKAAGVDMIMLTYSDIKFSPASLRALESVGWKLKQVPRISPPPATIEQYKDNYGRINLWAWTEYERIVYIDGDVIVMRDISALFLLPQGITAAVGDAWPDNLDNDHFNAGILSLAPRMEDFVEMIASYRNHTNYHMEGQAEQGLLNWHFKHHITILPRIYNFNLVLCSGHKALWDTLKGDARIVHFTIYKPGPSRVEDMKAMENHPDSRVNKDLQEPLSWWWDAYEEMSTAHGWNGTFAR